MDAGPNTYLYANSGPLAISDASGLDIGITYFPGRAGHIGIGIAPGSTYGLYPDPNANGWDIATCKSVSGGISEDQQRQDPKWISQSKTLIIGTSPDQDARIKQYIDQRRKTKDLQYNLCTQQCTSFVRDALRAGGVAGPGDDFVRPDTFFNALQTMYGGHKK